jgi:hypothetical protein
LKSQVNKQYWNGSQEVHHNSSALERAAQH